MDGHRRCTSRLQTLEVKCRGLIRARSLELRIRGDSRCSDSFETERKIILEKFLLVDSHLFGTFYTTEVVSNTTGMRGLTVRSCLTAIGDVEHYRHLNVNEGQFETDAGFASRF